MWSTPPPAMYSTPWDAARLPPATPDAEEGEEEGAGLPAYLASGSARLGIPHAIFIVQQAATRLNVAEEQVAFRFLRALAAAAPSSALPGSDVTDIAFINAWFASRAPGRAPETPDALYVALLRAARASGLKPDPRYFVPAVFSGWWSAEGGGGGGGTLPVPPPQPLASVTAAAAIARLLEARDAIRAEKRYLTAADANSVAELESWALATLDASMPLVALAFRLRALTPEVLHTALCDALLAASPGSPLERWGAACAYAPALVPSVPRTHAAFAGVLDAFYAQFGATEPLPPGAPIFHAHIFADAASE